MQCQYRKVLTLMSTRHMSSALLSIAAKQAIPVPACAVGLSPRCTDHALLQFECSCGGWVKAKVVVGTFYALHDAS